MWNWRLLGVTGEARYADVMEQGIYNTGLSGVSIDGEHFCYTNPLRWHGAGQDLLSHDTPARWFTHDCYCCPPQVARTIARMHNWAYGLSKEGVWVHLYGGSHLATTLADGSPVALRQESNYPWDGEIRITVEEAPDALRAPFAIVVRIPSWATGATLTINGVRVPEGIQPGAYVPLTRAWSPGDEVRLSLPMRVRLLKAHHRVEEARNQVAVMRGPVVYCLESVDLPEGVSASEIHLSRDVQLSPRYDAELLGGVVVLEGDAYRIHEDASSPDASGDALYSEIGGERVDTMPVRLIPYYAWNNRGETEMTVWMPLF
jgi:DUF1680 family protein